MKSSPRMPAAAHASTPCEDGPLGTAPPGEQDACLPEEKDSGARINPSDTRPALDDADDSMESRSTRRPDHEDAAAPRHLPLGLTDYGAGRAYVRGLANAARASLDREDEAVEIHFAAADRLLWPLGDLDDVHSLRDFIAGAAREAESLLFDLRKNRDS